jgi:hypothetical protein
LILLQAPWLLVLRLLNLCSQSLALFFFQLIRRRKVGHGHLNRTSASEACCCCCRHVQLLVICVIINQQITIDPGCCCC